MGDISPNFNRSEFACRDGCGFDTVDVELIEVLQGLREHFNRPVFVTSGCRCEMRNVLSGGSKNSQHLIGRAADIVVNGHKAHEVYDYLDKLYPDQYGIGRYDHWTHIDTRNEKARW